MEREERELWVERALAGEVTPGEWDDLELESHEHTELWRELARAWRDQSELGRVVGEIEGRAESLELGDLVDASRASKASRLPAWSGWAAAAAIALVWAGANLVGGRSANPLDTLPTHEPGGAYRRAEMKDAHVVNELPLVLVDTRPLPGGDGVEVVYLRQLLERRTVSGIVERGTDEWGRPMATPVSGPPSRLEEL